jgi:DnaJ-class molecular chaperone
VQVNSGTAIGQQIVFAGDGDESPGAQRAGDYVVSLTDAHHAVYSRRPGSDDLVVVVQLHAANAMAPVTVSFPALSGETLTVTHSGPVSDGDVITLEGKGLRRRDAAGASHQGDVVTVFQLLQ